VFSSSNYSNDNSAAVAFVNAKRVKVAVTTHSKLIPKDERVVGEKEIKLDED